MEFDSDCQNFIQSKSHIMAMPYSQVDIKPMVSRPWVFSFVSHMYKITYEIVLFIKQCICKIIAFMLKF